MLCLSSSLLLHTKRVYTLTHTLYFALIALLFLEFTIFSLQILNGAQLCILGFHSTIEMFAVSLFLTNLIQSIIYGLQYSYVSEQFPTWFAKKGTAYFGVSWSFLMIVMISICYFTCTWQNIIIHFMGIPSIILGVTGFCVRKYIRESADC